ncbi:MAG: CHAD domain-containing protein [Bacteroidales bacterium]|nr:CHAD domain-containing protein [Bacteroidales bacterium]
MYSKYLSAYIEQTQMFFSQLEIAEKTIGIEAIHEMRVAVKKIRSLSKMFKELFSDTSGFETGFKYLRKIFKSAAGIRDSHVMTELINQYKTDSSGYNDLLLYFKFLENESVGGFIVLVKEIKNAAFKTSFDYIEWLKRQNVNTQINRRINLYVKKKIIEVSDFLEIVHDERSIHKFRIKFKEINFLLGVQNDIEKIPILSELKISASELGLWHDKIILTYHLANFIDNSDNKKNLSEYFQLKKLIISENKNESEKILFFLKKKFGILYQSFNKNIGL